MNSKRGAFSAIRVLCSIKKHTREALLKLYRARDVVITNKAFS